MAGKSSQFYLQKLFEVKIEKNQDSILEKKYFNRFCIRQLPLFDGNFVVFELLSCRSSFRFNFNPSREEIEIECVWLARKLPYSTQIFGFLFLKQPSLLLNDEVIRPVISVSS